MSSLSSPDRAGARSPVVLTRVRPLRFDLESQSSQNLDRAGLAALEIARCKACRRRHLVGASENRLRRIGRTVPEQLIGRRRSEAVLSEELLRSQAIELLDRRLDIGP